MTTMRDAQPIDPATHRYCARLACRLVGIILPALRPEEIHDEHQHHETQNQAKRA
jgi:hypothetical protein